MIKRLYYTCPIQALYMNREFGVQFDHLTDDGSKHELDGGDAQDLEFLEGAKFMCEDKLWVAEESLPIFDPQQGDRGISKDESRAFLRFNANYNTWFDSEQDQFNGDAQIIWRNSKSFFSPLEE